MLGMSGRSLLSSASVVSALGWCSPSSRLTQVRNLPVHKSMAEISDLIWETCKTYLITQGKFILILEIFIGSIIVIYFGALQHFPIERVLIILAFSLVGIGGQLRRRLVRHPHQHLRQQPHGVRQPARASPTASTRFR